MGLLKRDFLFSDQKGQSLLEILISLAVVTLVLISVVSRATDAARNAAFSRNQVLSARFAQEGIEWARAQRDQMGWEAFEALIIAQALPVTYCVLDISIDLASLSSGNCSAGSVITNTIFDREVVFNHENPDAADEDRVDVVSTVSWTDSSGVHEAEYTTKLSEWLNP